MLSWSILQYFWPALSDNPYLNPNFGLPFKWPLKKGFTVFIILTLDYPATNFSPENVCYTAG